MIESTSSDVTARLPVSRLAAIAALENLQVMRMKTIRLICPLALIVLLAACNTPRSPAPVVDRGTASRPGESGRPVNGGAGAPQRVADPRGFYTVRKGDTLLHIAVEFGQNYRDLVVWNNLANANDIKVDQLLRVSPPEPGSGAPQAASVSVGSGVEVRPLGTAPGVAPGVAPIVSSIPAAAPAVTAPGNVVNKNGPHGEKRPYSDTALAELQKPESNGYSASGGANAGASKTGEVKNSVPPVAMLTPNPAPATVAPNLAPVEDDNISWIWPTDGKVASGFDDGRKGIDIAGRSGQQIVAASGGKVMYAGAGIRGYGNLVIVKHTSNLLSAYAHNKTILVKEGQTVSKGQKIAEMGNSDSDVVKLHFEIRQQGKPVDPSKFLPSR